MIQIENLKAVLSEIGFVKEAIGDYFQIDYGTCIVAVDFDNKKIIYPEGKGLKVNDKTTSNFEHPDIRQGELQQRERSEAWKVAPKCKVERRTASKVQKMHFRRGSGLRIMNGKRNGYWEFVE